jgi:Ser/Thr protein kinase RdoA (MazF antagonist)
VTAQPTVYRKYYPDHAARCRAERNYRWLASLSGPFRLPRLLFACGQQIGFEHIRARHAEPSDLAALASYLGRTHAIAYAATLRQANLAIGAPTPASHQIPGFLDQRMDAVARELASGRVPSPAFTTSQAHALLREACAGPAAFYKDANPRNFLITPAGPVIVDFDELTLAPFGYDLAKLIVTLGMTHGRLPSTMLVSALHAYNAATGHLPAVAPLTWTQLMNWAEIHHILTSRYHGHTGYQHRWPNLRPARPAAAKTL